MKLFSVASGYFFAVIVGHVFIKWLVEYLWRLEYGQVPQREQRPSPHLPPLVGFVERTLYVAALQFSQAEFIAVWLALKVAGQWKRWEEGHGEVSGRVFFNIFLVGSGLSIAFAVAGARLIDSIAQEDVWNAFATCCVPVLGSVALLVYARATHSS
jgi:hypothetical protein